MSIEMIINLQ